MKLGWNGFPPTLSLLLVVHSDRLPFIQILVLSSQLYSCRPLAQLPSSFPFRMVFIRVLGFLMCPTYFIYLFWLFLSSAFFSFSGPLYLFVSMILDQFFCIPPSPKPQFYFSIVCSLSRFLCHRAVSRIHNTWWVSFSTYWDRGLIYYLK